MKTLRTFAPLMMALVMSGMACAADGDVLLKDSGCMSCHAKAEKVVGPSFLSVADKYRNDKDAVATLLQSIQNGSKGKWGRMPMPPHASISQDDLKSLARHILATKP